MNHLPKQLGFIFGLSLFLSLMFLTSLYLTTALSPFYRNRADITSSPSQTNEFVTTVSVSEAIETDNRVVAQKLNLQRKMIVPESRQELAAMERVVTELGGTVIKSSEDVLVVELPKETESEITRELQESNLTESVEVDYPVYLTVDRVDWGLEKLEVPEVWPTTQGAGVKVAVVDTGIDYNHPDLQGRYVGGYDFVSDDADPFDDHGHGTHVAGVIAANANGSGIQGAAAQASLVAAKVLAADGTGYLSDIIEAVEWAAQQNVQVMNFSLGTTYNSSMLETKLQQAASKGIVLVAAAGNTNGGPLMYPAAYSTVISVSATDQNDNFASFSSVGAEVAAPGVGITSTVPGGGFASWSGTSMAAPHVAASVALMLANQQSDVRSRLHETALDLGPAGKDAYYGYGRIMSKPAILGEDTLAPVISFIEPINQTQVGTNITIHLDIQDEYRVVEATLSAQNSVLTRWQTNPYTFEWDASAFAGQTVTLIAEAVDDSGNVGAVQIQVTVDDSVAPPPDDVSPTASVSASPTKGKKIPEKKPSMPPQAHEKKENKSSATDNTPAVTNIDQRNLQPTIDNKPAEQPQPQEAIQPQQQSKNETSSVESKPVGAENASEKATEAKEKGKPSVKGITTESKPSLWEWILRWFRL